MSYELDGNGTHGKLQFSSDLRQALQEEKEKRLKQYCEISFQSGADLWDGKVHPSEVSLGAGLTLALGKNASRKAILLNELSFVTDLQKVTEAQNRKILQTQECSTGTPSILERFGSIPSIDHYFRAVRSDADQLGKEDRALAVFEGMGKKALTEKQFLPGILSLALLSAHGYISGLFLPPKFMDEIYQALEDQSIEVKYHTLTFVESLREIEHLYQVEKIIEGFPSDIEPRYKNNLIPPTQTETGHESQENDKEGKNGHKNSETTIPVSKVTIKTPIEMLRVPYNPQTRWEKASLLRRILRIF